MKSFLLKIINLLAYKRAPAPVMVIDTNLVMATPKQVDLMVKNGYTREDAMTYTKSEASGVIDELIKTSYARDYYDMQEFLNLGEIGDN